MSRPASHDNTIWTEDRFAGTADAIYETLASAHQGLTNSESERLDTYLVLLLAHLVGDYPLIEEAVRVARAVVCDGATRRPPVLSSTDRAAHEATQ